MGRRRNRSSSDDVIKLIGLGVILLTMTGALVPVLITIAIVVAAIAGIGGIGCVAFRKWGNKPSPELVPRDQKVEISPDIEVECPNCKNDLVAPADMAGQKVKCEACHAVFTIPKPKLMISDHARYYYSDTTHSENPAKFSIQLLRELEWKRFEQVVEAYFAKTGWRTRLNRTGPDGGVDIDLFKPGQDGVAAVVQCKAWNTYKVGIKPVRELLGVMAAGKVPEGYFFTTEVFTQEALDFAGGQPLTLVDGFGFLRRIHALPEADQSALLNLATSGDYMTPTCPSCGRKMVKRVSGKGRNTGESFWGCPSYPRCRAHLNMKKDVSGLLKPPT